MTSVTILYLTPPGLTLYMKFWNITDGPVIRTLELHCCCCSVAKSCHSLCDPMKCSMPGFPVSPLPELAQTQAH